ncbi:MAG: hypothetical protein HY650_08755 [Acidobacteria bacterium]|nr:hypothetical protein [Acidobacteriota bacterium]
MINIRLKVDISGTLGDDAWRAITPFIEIAGSSFGAAEGGSGPCAHPPDLPHPPGEWRGARVQVETDVLAMYAVAHYQRQKRVLDATIEE